MRLLDLAARLADCPIAGIGILDQKRFRLLLSRGFPLSEIEDELPRFDRMAERLREPCIIPDLAADPDLRHHPYVSGPLRLRFQASVPLAKPLFDEEMLLLCADPRVDRPRRRDLLELLGECAAVIGEQLALTGAMARQSERLGKARRARNDLLRLAERSPLPIALVDRDLKLLEANQPFAQQIGSSLDALASRAVPDLILGTGRLLTDRLVHVLQTGEAAFGLTIDGAAPGESLLIDAVPMDVERPGQPAMLIRLQPARPMAGVFEPPAEAFTDRADVVGNFLFDTLVHRPRLLRRNLTSYHGLYRWRANMKSTQVAALRALKRNPPPSFVDRVARSLAAGADDLFGSTAYRAVVAVPCGHSGPGCLTELVAERLAALVGKPLVRAFAPIEVSGSSHPRRNPARPPIRLEKLPESSVLLIDDVASSGQHIDECASLLRRGRNEPVFGLVWISG
ncbi:MAG: hypothetical protein ACK4Z0_01950 [Sphingomonadaceae bacterium]